MSVLPQLFESIAYGINDKKSTKGTTNETANKAKHKNYELVQQKMNYKITMLHKASLSGKLFIFFIFELVCYFIKLRI